MGLRPFARGNNRPKADGGDRQKSANSGQSTGAVISSVWANLLRALTTNTPTTLMASPTAGVLGGTTAEVIANIVATASVIAEGVYNWV